jgi:hypothetical protein
MIHCDAVHLDPGAGKASNREMIRLRPVQGEAQFEVAFALNCALRGKLAEKTRRK